MMNMDIQTISIIIAAIGVFIAAINSVYSSRESRQQRQTEIDTRQAELFMNVYNRWNTKEMQAAYGLARFDIVPKVKDYEDWRQNYSVRGGPQNLETWLNLQLLVTYFEGLGMLVKKGLIDIDMVDDLFAGRIKWYWESGEILWQGAREGLRDPQLYDSVEYLYHAIQERDQQSKPSS
jgi:hypothetical protein